jgi:hypothetical protein
MFESGGRHGIFTKDGPKSGERLVARKDHFGERSRAGQSGAAVNRQERSVIADGSPTPSKNRRRWLTAIIAGAILVCAAGLAALWYLRVCRDCAPILCDDPCTLPTYSSKTVEPLTGQV